MITLDQSNPEHRGLARIILAKTDMRGALAALSYITDSIHSQNDALYHPLICAAVICYSRPFIRTKLYPGLPDKYESFVSKGLKVQHLSILDHRNAFVAHRDRERNIVELVPKGSTISWDGGKQGGVLISHGDMVDEQIINIQSIDPFTELVKYQVERLEADIKAEKERLFP